MGHEYTLTPLTVDTTPEKKVEHYKAVQEDIRLICEGETDWISVMCTVVCELNKHFDYFHWTGFYRNVGNDMLAVGPYQGGHGCLRIPFSKGVCGAAARERRTQLVPDVHAFPGHIACASSTQSEVVVPVFTAGPEPALIGVLDIDSDLPGAFTAEDQEGLEALCKMLGEAQYDAKTVV